METKLFSTCKDLVYSDLNQRREQGTSTATIANYSSSNIELYYFELKAKAHLCKRPVNFNTVNRYVETWVKAQLILESIASQ